ncbi:MAG: isoprenylcysteine carboxylmethyltransferase family protein, partial [Patescibacteria group bacterium]
MTKDAPQIPVIPPAIYLIPLVIGLIIEYFLPFRLLPNQKTADVVGWPLIIGSILLGVWAVMTMRRVGESEDFRKPTDKIVTTGPYAFTRNPMYVSLNMVYVGIAFMLNTAWLMLFWPFAFAFLYYKVILREEDYLEKKLGKEYRRYKSKVRRFL